MKTGCMMVMVAFLALASHAQELRPLPDMSSAKVPTARDAEAIVMKYIMALSNDGVSATETITGKLAFALGVDLPGFGKRGDRVWQVHRVSFAETTSIIWVNAETKSVHVVYPVKEQKAEPSAAPLPSAPAGPSEGAR